MAGYAKKYEPLSNMERQSPSYASELRGLFRWYLPCFCAGMVILIATVITTLVLSSIVLSRTHANQTTSLHNNGGTTPMTPDAGVFSFAVMGDTNYGNFTLSGREDGYFNERAVLDHLTRHVNEVDFLVHVGDISGSQQCSDEFYAERYQTYNGLALPVIYTPGDNEWTDCWNARYLKNGTLSTKSRSPAKALAALRNTFFSDDKSLGQRKIRLTRQSDGGDSPFTTTFDESLYRENQVFVHKGMVIATAHIVGSSDNCVQVDTIDPTLDYITNTTAQLMTVGALRVHYDVENVFMGVCNRPDGYGQCQRVPSTTCGPEKRNREAANLAWIEKVFAMASRPEHHGIIINAQADFRFFKPFNYANTSAFSANIWEPYDAYMRAIQRLALRLNKPVLYVHGDNHYVVFDRPFPAWNVDVASARLKAGDWPANAHFFGENPFAFRLQVPGYPRAAWTKITVDTRPGNALKAFTFSVEYEFNPYAEVTYPGRLATSSAGRFASMGDNEPFPPCDPQKELFCKPVF